MDRFGAVVLACLLLSGCMTDVTQPRPQLWSASFPDVAVASGEQLVRVVTPFADPVVRTTSSAQIEPNENVLYVVPSDDQPIAMFISEGTNESSSIDVTMTPREGGVRIVDLAQMTDRAVAEPVANAQVRSASKPKAGAVSIEVEEPSTWGRPCKLCRDQDDEDDGYDRDKW